MLKIGWIDFLNTLPFCFENIGLKPEFEYKLIKGYPSQINQYLKEGFVDVGAISSAEYIENFEKYFILPDISISANNKVYSVAILSNKPIESINTIYLSKASKSSRILTKIIFEKFFNKRAIYKDLENYENIEKKSVLLIGDNAILFANRFKYIYDLSEYWYKKTGYPFVFALWCVRKELSRKKEIKKLYKILMETKNKFFSNIDNNLKNTKINRNFAVKYLKNLDYNLSKEHINSLKLFAKYTKELGLIKKLPEFNIKTDIK